MAPKILPEDDKLHPRSSSLYWNESAWFNFKIPERGLDGWVYFFHRPNMQKSTAGVAMWDSTGDEVHNCVFYEFDENLAFPDGAEMFDFALDNGVRCQTVEVQKEYRLGFDREGFEVDLTWTAVMPPHSTRDPEELKEDEGILGWIAEGGARRRGYRSDPIGSGGNRVGHYEQAGRTRGFVTVDGERLAVDSLGMRDHSWGPRTVSPEAPRARFDWAVGSENDGFVVWSVANQPWRQDPVVGATESVIDGWYCKDGVMGDIRGGKSRITERDSMNRVLRIEIDAEDHLGRTLHAQGTRGSALNWLGYAFSYTTWAMAEWEWDGRSCHGESVEYLTQRQYRRMTEAVRAGLPAVRTD